MASIEGAQRLAGAGLLDVPAFDAAVWALDNYARGDLLVSLQEHLPRMFHNPLSNFLCTCCGLGLLYLAHKRAMLAHVSSTRVTPRILDSHGVEIRTPKDQKRPQWLLPIAIVFVLAFMAAPILSIIYSLAYKGLPPKAPATPAVPDFAYNKTPPRPKPFVPTLTANQARVGITSIEPLLADSIAKGKPPWSLISVKFKNFGDLPADQIASRVTLLPAFADVSSERIAKEQDALLSFDGWTAAMASRSGSELFKEDDGNTVSFPSSQQDSIYPGVEAYFASTDPAKRIYVFFTLKYRDSSMPANVRAVSERCAYFFGFGSDNGEHVCGRNRIFLEQFKPATKQAD